MIMYWPRECLFHYLFIHLIPQKISAETAKPKSVKIVSSRPSQKSILAGIVRKRKPSPSSDEPNEQPKKRTPNELTNANDSNEKKPVAVVNKEDKPVAVVNKEEKISPIAQQNVEEKISPSKSSPPESPIVVSDLSKYDEGALKCIGILPGIGKYTESSDSEKSTDTDDEYDFGEFDWMGRKTKQDGEGSGCHWFKAEQKISHRIAIRILKFDRRMGRILLIWAFGLDTTVYVHHFIR